MKSAIRFFEEDDIKAINFPRRILKEICAKIFADYKKSVHFVNIIFCTDENLLEINKTHLNHDYYTDIITFDYDAGKVSSDIYISTDRVRENAAIAGVNPKMELCRVVIHGCIHLCGFSDKTTEEKSVMTGLEDAYLRLVDTRF